MQGTSQNTKVQNWLKILMLIIWLDWCCVMRNLAYIVCSANSPLLSNGSGWKNKTFSSTEFIFWCTLCLFPNAGIGLPELNLISMHKFTMMLARRVYHVASVCYGVYVHIYVRVCEGIFINPLEFFLRCQTSFWDPFLTFFQVSSQPNSENLVR